MDEVGDDFWKSYPVDLLACSFEGRFEVQEGIQRIVGQVDRFERWEERVGGRGGEGERVGEDVGRQIESNEAREGSEGTDREGGVHKAAGGQVERDEARGELKSCGCEGLVVECVVREDEGCKGVPGCRRFTQELFGAVDKGGLLLDGRERRPESRMLRTQLCFWACTRAGVRWSHQLF